jgi:formate dehydrogenase subunit delta
MTVASKPDDINTTVLAMERILIMAEQIGFFFAPYPPLRAAEGVRNHLRTYWDPRMRDALLAHIDAGASGLASHVVAGAQLLRESMTEQKKGYYGPPQA